jgi:predicted AAA+ superfamily ATPase
MQEARMRFPGRRGRASVVNFHLYTLSFREVVQLKHANITDPSMDLLFSEFENYLIHGGYLTAINNLAMDGCILGSTLMTYSDWIRGDMIKRGKQDHYLREILHAIIKRYGSQITWNALGHDLSIDHPKTIADYISLLESMDAIFVQSALLEDKLTGAPKKARKVMFTDPFVYHAIQAWLVPVNDPYKQQILPLLQNSIACSTLVECCAVTHYRRHYPTYYIKAEGEVDIAYVKNKTFWPVEIKWTEQIREKNLKQTLKYPNAMILTKNISAGSIQHIPTQPLPLALWNMMQPNMIVE